jgi:hypothetical protein
LSVGFDDVNLAPVDLVEDGGVGQSPGAIAATRYAVTQRVENRKARS